MSPAGNARDDETRHRAAAIGAKAERKLRAGRERRRSIWFGLGMFGLVGWSVALPTLVGATLGLWLDARLDGRVSWTLTLLFLGLTIGCVTAWRWVHRESGLADPTEGRRP